MKKFAFLLLVFLILSGNVGAVLSVESFIIAESGKTYINQDMPDLIISATDANDMAFSCNNIAYTEPYTTFSTSYSDFNILDTAYGCTPGEGTKTIHIKVESADGNTVTDSNSSIYDVTAPTTTIDYNAGVWQTGDANVHFTCNDAFGECAAIYVDGDIYQKTDVWVMYTTDGNNEIDFLSVDKASNQEETQTIHVLIDKSIPTINNKIPTSNISNATPTISFDVNDSASGVDISTLFLFINGNLIATPDIKSFENNKQHYISWDFNYELANGKIVYISASAEDGLGNSTRDVNWNFMVDTEAPTFDGIAVVDYTNDSTPTISLENVAGSPTEMAISCDNPNWKDWQPYSANVTDFSITSASYGCLNESEGSVTIYIILKDEAGNESGEKNYETVYDISPPDTPTLDSATGGNKDVYLDWGSVSDSSGIKEYIIYKNGSEIHTTTATDYDASGLTNGTEYNFKIRARDNAGNLSGYSNEESATPTSSDETDNGNNDDTSAPYLAWEKPITSKRDDISGTIMLKVRSYDNESNMRYVEFMVDNVLIKRETSENLERYIFDWNSATVVDGTHTLKAVSKNWSGTNNDTTTKTITVTTNNGITAITAATDTVSDNTIETIGQDAIDAADDAKEDAAKLFGDLELLGISPSTATSALLLEGSELLDNAQTLFDEEDFNAADEKALEAMDKFNQLFAIVSVEDYGEKKKYVYNEEHLELLLKGIGFGQALIDEAKEQAGKATVDRTLSFKKISGNDGIYYKALITIVVKNAANTIGVTEPKSFKIIEVVPKEFAALASEIAGKNFTVIVDDPVLEWLVSLKTGKEAIIVYSLKSELTAEQVDAMVDSEILNKFSVPPVLVSSETEMSETSFSGTAIGLFGLGGAVELGGWVVLIIAIVAIVALFVTGRIGKEKETPFGIQAATGRAGFGSGFFDKLGKSSKKEESSGPKWKYSD